MKKIFLFSCLILIPFITFSQVISDSVETEDYNFQDRKVYGTKLYNLPKHIPIEDNKAFLFADFNNVQDSILPIYIINTTSESLKLRNEILILQQYKDSGGNWIRSQSFNYSWCGTGFLLDFILRPNEFYKTTVELYPEGEESTIRYSLYHKDYIISSNAGVGLIDEKEIEVAKYDDVAFSFNGLDFLVKIINGEITPFSSEEENEHLIFEAIIKIALYYPDDSLIILESIANDSSNKFQAIARKNLDFIYKK